MSRRSESITSAQSDLELMNASDRLLFDCGKESVVLYVGYENSAQKVYHRVGFAGLCGDAKVDGVEDSLELGFVGSSRGHW